MNQFETSVRRLHLLLALANFAVGLGAFVVIGVLSPVAASFQITPSEAGWLMTIYAITYAISSPFLVAITGSKDRAYVLFAGLILLILGSTLAIFSPDFSVLLVARVFMAIGSGVVTPVASAIGAASVNPEHRGRALATVFGGLTMAQAFGIPAGAWIGYAFGWRFTFGVVALLAFVCLVILYKSIQRGIVAQPNSLSTLKEVVLSPRLTIAVFFIVLFMGGIFTFYTYLTPFLEIRYGIQKIGVTSILLIFGLGAIFGNKLGGFLTDKIGAVRTLVMVCTAQIVILPVLTLVQMPLYAIGILIFVWSVFGWSSQVAQQARLTALDSKRAPVLLALHSASIYVGTSLGALVGGKVIHLTGYSSLGMVASGIVVISLLLLAGSQTKNESSQPVI
ncbi:MFS transporter [Leptospira ilyithenensis]|uniref:MFS transporter n=1 Tax=Leptospira ilyithenensis TaxID=2484901 RepID=UPI00143853E1|nr:MFS transporter [Leptospira ilyithenensis]